MWSSHVIRRTSIQNLTSSQTSVSTSLITGTSASVFLLVRFCWQWRYKRNPTDTSASELPRLLSLVTRADGNWCSFLLQTAYTTCKSLSLWWMLPVSFTKLPLYVCDWIRLRIPINAESFLLCRRHMHNTCASSGREGNRVSLLVLGNSTRLSDIRICGITLKWLSNVLLFMNTSAWLPNRCLEQGTELCSLVGGLNGGGMHNRSLGGRSA
jgi:hypothetical protein